ncbi:MAG TPA: MdtA/MuxA family multidrug efflux RND transporter periplasmic adaptor subunit [Stellaceae bacterium]|jgi:multidrug efflux system membrane fusion protein
MDDQRSDIEAPSRPGGAEREFDHLDTDVPDLPPPGEPAPPRRSWLRRLAWLLVILAVAVGVVWYLPHLKKAPAPTGRVTSTGPVPVGTTSVAAGNMPVTLSGLGTVTPLATVTVKTQINGYLMSVGFKEGQHVNKGDFLAQIDPRPYQVALEQAEGQLGKDQALLKNAQHDLERYNTLVAQNSIARQTRDTQVSLVAQYQAALVSDKAQIDAQKLNLVYAHITSPVTGRVGLRQVDPGNYVQTSDPNGIVVVTQTQPISVIFTLPEDDLPAVLKQLHAGAQLPTTAYDRTGLHQLGIGRLETVDNQIDTTTGTVKLRAIFDNPDETLFPNQFVNVKLLVETLRGVDIVPNAAIQRGAPGTFVYLVQPNQTVSVQKVTLGPTDGQHIVVTQGLKPGDKVVTDGADRLKDGAKVMLASAAGKAPQGGAKPGPGQSGQQGHRHGGSRGTR